MTYKAWAALLVLAALTGCANTSQTGDPYLQAVRDADSDLPPGTIRDCAICPEMQVIPAGSFVMGAPTDQVDTLPGAAASHVRGSCGNRLKLK